MTPMVGLSVSKERSHISNLHDCNFLLHDPEQFREVTSYLLYCQHESREDDDHNFIFSVLQESDLPMLNSLGPPEETVQISIKADGHLTTMYRIVYPTEVLFILAEISDQFSLKNCYHPYPLIFLSTRHRPEFLCHTCITLPFAKFSNLVSRTT